MSAVTYSNGGKIMFKRPKKDVVNNAIYRTTAEDEILHINFRCDSADGA